MKSAHRHELETNALAHRLEAFIERYKPYGSRIAGVLIAVIVLIFIWSYVAGSSTERQSTAWDTFNRAIGSSPPNLDEIHRTAQDFPNTQMQEMADVTWADAQVYVASRGYLANRKVAMETLDKAASAYQSIIQSTKNDQLIGRAHLGLARIYEMQNHLDKARDEYGKVTGAYANYAKAQAERLAKPESQETYAWLATAQPPQPKPPMGPGTPGKPPEFSPGEMGLPPAGGADAGKADSTKGAERSVRQSSQKFERREEGNARSVQGRPKASRRLNTASQGRNARRRRKRRNQTGREARRKSGEVVAAVGCVELRETHQPFDDWWVSSNSTHPTNM